jgi:prepilin signal peptidase PulO-like enzyme (type II secretory pathway)
MSLFGAIDTSEAMILLTQLILFTFGLCVGSFLNVVIDRLPRDETVIKGRSYCEHCQHQLKWYDLVPVLSFLLLRGRCRYCRQKIFWQYPLVELATGLLFVSSTFVETGHAPSLPFILYSLFLIPIFVIDLKYGTIPDKLVYPAIGLVGGMRVIGVMGGIGRETAPLLWTLLGSLALYSSFFILHSLFKGRALGGGDVKLAFLVGLIADWPKMIVAVFSAFLTGALVSVILILLHQKKFGETVPFGPFLVAGTYTALFWGSDIIEWYLGLL